MRIKTILLSAGTLLLPLIGRARDATIDYHVSSAAGIDRLGLDFNGTFYGYAISSITETVYNGAGKQVGFAEVSCAKESLGGCYRTDNIALNGLYKISISRKTSE